MENFLRFTLSEMLKYVQMHREAGDTLNWSEILFLKDRPRISFIEVTANDDREHQIAFQGLQWNNRSNELKLQKIEVAEEFQKSRIGTTIIKMVIAIGIFYEAKRITGTVAGKPFLWDWYPKLGFTIYDGNKLLMELSEDVTK